VERQQQKQLRQQKQPKRRLRARIKGLSEDERTAKSEVYARSFFEIYETERAAKVEVREKNFPGY
jgi:cell division protein FtsB